MHSHLPLYPHTPPIVKGIRRNSSVPDLSEIGKLSASDSKSISDSKKLSDSTKLRTVN